MELALRSPLAFYCKRKASLSDADCTYLSGRDESSFGTVCGANSKRTRVIPLIALSVDATGATSRMEANST